MCITLWGQHKPSWNIIAFTISYQTVSVCLKIVSDFTLASDSQNDKYKSQILHVVFFSRTDVGRFSNMCNVGFIECDPRRATSCFPHCTSVAAMAASDMRTPNNSHTSDNVSGSHKTTAQPCNQVINRHASESCVRDTHSNDARGCSVNMRAVV